MLLAGLILLVAFIESSNAQPREFDIHFGSDYDYAINFVNQNHQHFKGKFPDKDDCLVAAATVFPELIRHNKIQNFIETSVLKALYVQYGWNYANFSIGFFQMKPAFAEKLEKEWIRKGFPCPGFMTCPSEFIDSAEIRAKRISRLNTLSGQIVYLQMFYKLMECRFSGYGFSTMEEKIRIYATAYNSGTDHSYSQLNRLSGLRQFHTDLFKTPGTICYSYADIAVDYALRHQASGLFSAEPVAGIVK